MSLSPRQIMACLHTAARVLVVALGLLLVGGFYAIQLEAAPPRPSFTLYGKAYDPFGWPYMSDNTVVVARQGETELARFRINSDIGPTSNYTLDLPGNRIGEPFSIEIVNGDRAWQIIGADQLPLLGGPGEVARRDLLAGTDSCGDGLPDEWKWWVVHSSGGAFTNITEILPDDDFDGDGMTNREEYLAGTDPTWDVDVFAIEELWRHGEWIELGWYTVPGMTYRLHTNAAIAAAHLQWQPASFRISPHTNAPQETLFEARWYYSRIYVPTDSDSGIYYRLKIHR